MYKYIPSSASAAGRGDAREAAAGGGHGPRSIAPNLLSEGVISGVHFLPVLL